MNEENKNLEEVIKKYIGVILEDSKSNFNALADGQKALEQKVDRLTEDLSVVKKDVELLKEDMDYVKSNLVDNRERFKEIDGTADNHEKRLIKLENSALVKI